MALGNPSCYGHNFFLNRIVNIVLTCVIHIHDFETNIYLHLIGLKNLSLERLCDKYRVTERTFRQQSMSKNIFFLVQTRNITLLLL